MWTKAKLTEDGLQEIENYMSLSQPQKISTELEEDEIIYFNAEYPDNKDEKLRIINLMFEMNANLSAISLGVKNITIEMNDKDTNCRREDGRRCSCRIDRTTRDRWCEYPVLSTGGIMWFRCRHQPWCDL